MVPGGIDCTGMRPLSIRRAEVTRERLLALAEELPGAWLGIKIAVLVLSCWTGIVPLLWPGCLVSAA